MFAAAATFALIASASAAAPLLRGNGDVIPGQYMVMFHKTSTLADRDAHYAKLNGLMQVHTDAEIMTTYSFMDFYGYAATLNSDLLDAIAAEDHVVDYIEQGQKYYTTMPVKTDRVVLNPGNVSKPAACIEQTEATWGLVRVAQRDLNIDGIFPHDTVNAGQGVSAYIIDTGVYLQHVEFEGRAIAGASFIAGESADNDLNGHGTHVAGTVAGVNFGIAKKATIVGVKVLSQFGSGTFAGVISGMEWTCQDHTTKRNKCVTNMSLGGGKSAAVNAAVDAMVRCGCSSAIASGNEARDACNSSPASAELGFTVNAMDNTDTNAWFSNYGTCTQIYAPGLDITSAWIGGTTAINTISGTSMAAPHVCGVMAKIAQTETDVPANLYDELKRDSTPNKITGVPGGASTPNLLVHTSCSV